MNHLEKCEFSNFLKCLRPQARGSEVNDLEVESDIQEPPLAFDSYQPSQKNVAQENYFETEQLSQKNLAQEIDLNELATEVTIKCGRCGITLLAVSRTYSHFKMFPKHIRTTSCFSHNFAQFQV